MTIHIKKELCFPSKIQTYVMFFWGSKMLVVGFVLTMLVFLGIGLLSMKESKDEVSDYLVAGRNISPISAGLSAVASNNSGFMFIGAIGFTYQYGLSAFWLLFAWIAGDYLSWFVVHKRLRIQSEKNQSNSIAGFLAFETDTKESNRNLQIILGILTVLFLTLYAAAQLKAGGKALHSMLGWSPTSGVFLGMFMVALYSFSGGIRASIWTDIAQSFVMIFAMAVLVFVCHVKIIPIPEIISQLKNIDRHLIEWTPSDATLGLPLYALGWFLAGFGGIGQPHIIIRAMTLDHPQNIATMRRTYFVWYVLFSIFVFLVGLYARLYFEQHSDLLFDKETALPILAAHTLPTFLVGVILAALFAATMSTADSQVLASSASITQDIWTKNKDNYRLSKFSTIGVVVIAGGIAFVGPDSVFVLVTIAWGLMMTCFAPLMIVRVYQWNIQWQMFLLAFGLGLTAMLSWTYIWGLGDSVFDGSVGFLVASFLVFVLSKK